MTIGKVIEILKKAEELLKKKFNSVELYEVKTEYISNSHTRVHIKVKVKDGNNLFFGILTYEIKYDGNNSIKNEGFKPFKIEEGRIYLE